MVAVRDGERLAASRVAPHHRHRRERHALADGAQVLVVTFSARKAIVDQSAAKVAVVEVVGE